MSNTVSTNTLTVSLHTVIWQVARTWKEIMLFGFGKT